MTFNLFHLSIDSPTHFLFVQLEGSSVVIVSASTSAIICFHLSKKRPTPQRVGWPNCGRNVSYFSYCTHTISWRSLHQTAETHFPRLLQSSREGFFLVDISVTRTKHRVTPIHALYTKPLRGFPEGLTKDLTYTY